MRFTIFKSVQSLILSTSLLVSCFVLSNVYARDVYLVDDVSKNYMLSAHRLTSLFQKYGNIGYEIPISKYDHSRFYTVLRGSLDQPKWGAITVQVITLDKNGGDQQNDLILKSKEAALDFCTDLAVETNGGINTSLFAVDGPYHRVIMVPYTIAYDTGSQQADDGKSTPAIKYVMCPNYKGSKKWVLDPAIDGSEDEVTGILLSELNGTNYTVTCMTASGKAKTTFAFDGTQATNTDGTEKYIVNAANLTNLHQYNKYIGAQYCPVSKEKERVKGGIL